MRNINQKLLHTFLFLPVVAGAGCAAPEQDGAKEAVAPRSETAKKAPILLAAQPNETNAGDGNKKAEYVIPLPPAPPEELLNQWPPEMEAAFQARVRETLEHFKKKTQSGRYGNTFFENEKKSYGIAMLDFINGNQAPALKYLQSEDADAKNWNTVTDGIDFFPSFTIKHQGRKYFLFGQFMEPAYVERMKQAARKWTEIDPLKRPHPFFKKGGDGWTPETKNSWVDVRGTDNLRAMRETNVYLFAEEAGNEETRLKYKERLHSSSQRLYSTGLGEWDSENYFGHTTAAWLNAYDFAKDPEVRRDAKLALDWLMVAAALKYYRGGWPAPNKRDYGGASRVYGSLSSRFFQIYFGEHAVPNPDPEPDVVHAMTSHYRPPLVAMALARKSFSRPIEVLSAKPDYNDWSSKRAPDMWETMFYGNTFQMGSVVSKGGSGDVGPFKVGLWNSRRGVDFFLANTMPTVGHQGKNQGDQIGQFRNLLIWLRPAGDKPFYFHVPREVALEKEDGIWFWKAEKTFLALRPINLGDWSEVPITKIKKVKKEPDQIVPDDNFVDYIQWQTPANGANYAGFALEIGEGNYDAWKRAVKSKGTLDLSLLGDGVAKLTGSDGNTLRVDHNANDDLPLVHRNGLERKWSEETAVYRTVGDRPLISQEWGGRALTVNAGGYRYSAVTSPEITWSEKNVAP